jgi:hypothetical protein
VKTEFPVFRFGCYTCRPDAFQILFLVFVLSSVSRFVSSFLSGKQTEGNRPVARRNYSWGDQIKTCSVRIKITGRRVRVKIVVVERQYVLHILSVYLALVTQNAMRMRLIVFSYVAFPAVPYFSTLSHER